MSEEALQLIQDRIEIEELMHLYAEMVDQREWTQMDRIFALEATIDYASTGGQSGPFRETLAWLGRALESWPINLHFITNLVIEVDGDTARSRCYFHAPMGRNAPDGGQYIITNAGRYHDKLVRTADGWRIVERFCDQTIMQGNLPEGYEIPS
ncbi:MAG: nuclear transport factor 2 family protein [Myxococcota bacterium]|jgi:3-phenylpropionate/cinnamic acid dioxygenase small subunit